MLLLSVKAGLRACAVREHEATLSDPNVAKERGAELPKLVAALEAARAEVERLFTRWQELDAIAAGSPS